MSKDRTADPDQLVLSDFKEGMASWASAVQAHKQAPPDADFADRLAALGKGASEAARLSGRGRRGLRTAARAQGRQ